MSEQESKQLGLFRAAQANADILAIFQSIARSLASVHGEISIEDVRTEAERCGIEYTPGNWMGAVFRGFHWTGKMIAAKHKGSHARMVKTWQAVRG